MARYGYRWRYPQSALPPKRTASPDTGRDLFTDEAWASYVPLRRARTRGPFVYFIREADDPAGPVKIGWTGNPVLRLYGMQNANYRRLIIRQIVFGGEGLERELHALWPDARILGEWFGNGYQDIVLAVADNIARLQLEGRWADNRLTGTLLELTGSLAGSDDRK